MQPLRADSPLQYIRGVGPRLAEAFATLGLNTVGDLLEYFPFRHEQEFGEIEIADLRPGMTATIRGEVTHARRHYPNYLCSIEDGTGGCTLRWFNQPYSGRGLSIGATVIATGLVREYNGELEMVQPSVQSFAGDTVLLDRRPGTRQVGVYSGNQRIKSPSIRRAVRNILAHPSLPVDEIVPEALARRHALPSREAAIRQMHSPDSDKSLVAARARLAYEEFLLMELAMALRRQKLVALQVGRKLQVTAEIDKRIRTRFPFSLTPSQDKVVKEITRDLQSGRPMTRLLQGDVGSGKTVVALYACLAAIAGGRQAAIMAPTEILAQQHSKNIEKYLEGSRVRRVLLRGGISRAKRTDALKAIETGEMDLIVGTQALLESDVAFKDLAVVVVDEQHKFGVLQRASFRTKGPMPHYLVMTATPIPRTLAMTVFGDLDVSIIDASPPGRGKIITKVVTRRQWDVVMGYVRKRLEAGEQAFVVCPLIGASEPAPPRGGLGVPVQTRGFHAEAQKRREIDSNALSVRSVFDRLLSGPWRGLNVALLHGGMKTAEKDAVIGQFAAGKLHSVVSTTVVEVGVDIPNATMMVVEHADRFGLSQLHQLRGRVGRGSKDSLCVLIAYEGGMRAATGNPKSKIQDPQSSGPQFAAPRGKAAERLAVLAETTDGFKIAEADLRQRGPGQLFGTRQHGLPELRFGNIVDDFELLEKARRDAFDIVARDPTLARPEHAAMIPSLRKTFGDKLALIDAG